MFAASSLQPLLLVREARAAADHSDGRDRCGSFRFDGLRAGAALPLEEEEHSLIEAVVLWMRNRALD